MKYKYSASQQEAEAQREGSAGEADGEQAGKEGGDSALLGAADAEQDSDDESDDGVVPAGAVGVTGEQERSALDDGRATPRRAQRKERGCGGSQEDKVLFEALCEIITPSTNTSHPPSNGMIQVTR